MTTGGGTAETLRGRPHAGMPALDTDGPPVSPFEFWPMRVFYLPVALYIGWLGARHGGLATGTLANPGFPGGGLIGESKSSILDMTQGLARETVAPWSTVTIGTGPNRVAAALDEARQAMQATGLEFPIVTKPDIGCRGVGVRLAKDDGDLRRYLQAFPPGQTVVLQYFVRHEPEAGVFYIRHPGEARGRIFSLTLKYFPYVIGDGRSTLRQLILDDPRAGRIAHIYLPRHADRLDEVLPAGQPFRLAFAGSHSRGTIFRDGKRFITERMTDTFDRLARDIPNFHFGRFDVRFPDIKALQEGRDFLIVEVNGSGAEATHIWDRGTSLREAYAVLFEQYRRLYEIGSVHRGAGHAPMRLRELWRLYRLQKRLEQGYPLTE